jgi:Bacteriophage Lambda NinG protein
MKTCRSCRVKFEPVRPLQSVCSIGCAVAMGSKKKARAAEKARRDDKRRTRAQKDALKTLPMLIKEAQHWFNRFIRFRDIMAGHGCISSGAPYNGTIFLTLTGGGWDAGHYRSIGSAPHLRFVEDNVHLQSKRENRYNSGAAVDYRLGLIARIGIERVEALERDNTPRNYTRDDVRKIRDTYRAKARQLEKRMRADQ